MVGRGGAKERHEEGRRLPKILVFKTHIVVHILGRSSPPNVLVSSPLFSSFRF